MIDLVVASLDIRLRGLVGLDVSADTKALFISGYTADALHRKGIFEEGIQFLAKPMSPFELLKKVRSLLDERRKALPGRS